MSIRDDDKEWLLAQAGEIGLELTDEQVDRFCHKVGLAVSLHDEPRGVARYFEFEYLKVELLDVSELIKEIE